MRERRKQPAKKRAKTSLYLDERTKTVLNLLCEHFNIKTQQATMEYLIMHVARQEGLALPTDAKK